MIQKTHRAKKSLGQNFLKSNLALKKIIEAAEITPSDIILEIGPGKGILTEKLLEYAKTVIAVEKDRELFEFLQIKFSKQISTNNLILICEDILNFDPNTYALKPGTYKIVANIPYNITGAILKKFLTAGPPAGGQPQSMILMVQHEVAQRILARDGKESVLSISVKTYGLPKMILKVPARYFSPPPKVDSAVIAIKNISSKIFEESGISEDRFWQIVKAGFAHKRKKLSGNLKRVISGELGELAGKRAEDLSLLEWITLARQ